MPRKLTHRIRTASVVALASSLALLWGCTTTSTHESLPAGASAVDAGRRIFDTAIDRSGAEIPRTGGVGMMMGSGGGCASCHGADGRGRTTPMVQAPDITYANLTDPAGMVELDGSRGHTYTDDEIRRAVTEGIGADGDQLDSAMPRWTLTDQQWNDLLAYLQTLD